MAHDDPLTPLFTVEECTETALIDALETPRPRAGTGPDFHR